jgi:hypothetical protein
MQPIAKFYLKRGRLARNNTPQSKDYLHQQDMNRLMFAASLS